MVKATVKKLKVKKVYIIEDDKFYANVCKLKLEKEGFMVKCFDSFGDFSKNIGADQPDLLLLDLILPGKDGFEAIKEIKQNPKFKTVKVIAYSSLGQPEDQARIKKLGAVDYFVKSDISIFELVEKVKSNI